MVTEIKESEIDSYRLAKNNPTYAISMDDVPALVTHIALLDKASQREDIQIQQGLEERNNDIASRTVREEFGAQTPEQHNDAELFAIVDADEEMTNQLTKEQLAQLKKYTTDRLEQISKNHAKIEKDIANSEKQLRSLEEKLQAAELATPVNNKQVESIKRKIQEAQTKIENLEDERIKIMNNDTLMREAQTKISNISKNNGDEDAVEGKDTSEKFIRTWEELSGDRTIPQPLPGRTCIMALLPETSSSLPGGG